MFRKNCRNFFGNITSLPPPPSLLWSPPLPSPMVAPSPSPMAAFLFFKNLRRFIKEITKRKQSHYFSLICFKVLSVEIKEFYTAVRNFSSTFCKSSAYFQIFFFKMTSNKENLDPIPSDEAVGSVPSDGMVESVPSEGMADPIPRDGMVESTPNVGMVESIPNVGMVESTPSDRAVRSIPNVGIVESAPNVGKIKFSASSNRRFLIYGIFAAILILLAVVCGLGIAAFVKVH